MVQTSARRVVVTQRFFDEATVAWLEANGCQVEIAALPPGKADGDLTPEEIIALLEGAQGWIVGHARVTRAVMEALPQLQVISRRGVGYERVDVDAARELGRVVAIAAGGNDASVADHVIGLMIAVGRRFREHQANMEGGDWRILTGSDLYRKTVGVIGLGRIGRSVVRRLEGFEARVLVHSPSAPTEAARALGAEPAGLEALLEQSDYVTVHAPLTPQTRFMIDATAMGRMKPGAVLINTARGGLVQDAHLLAALKSGHLGGAGLDVWVSESDPEFRPVSEALLAMPNVIGTPHSAASSKEGLDRTNRVAAEAVVAVLDGRDPAPECVVADGRSGR
ncbi:MAG: D-3-phosphoglycerate dehydrogenase [Brevundimonas sp.]|jgi:D-3-phosphoglycerate dehydrogenase|uniref:phosphoglycerate dehydrogenase n=1 Tax=Brevundimonas sp. TaxID=1871086 RepID=UPI0039E38F0C